MVSSSSSLWSANGNLLLQQQSCSSFSNYRHSATPTRWGFRKEIDLGPAIRRTKDEAFRVANPNVTIASGRSRKEVIMVDPR
ncbi:unnamed protein product [Lactuca virosa]|uniref:Uncharacterized protein n=1 Tax=Lactuca virosa TaxID=75947 RepID=A0AAU9N8H9_9ASTR|nr:unnamed protein product [Lactuca virosa]